MCVVPETNVLHQQELCDMGCRDHNERDVLNLYPAANAPNNGSYTWRGNYYGSALDYGFSDGTPSGCDYSIQLKVWTDIVYSPYFTIINPKDGGLDPASQCPSGDEAAVGPTSRTCKCGCSFAKKVALYADDSK
jgi:hypothetical protein